MLCTVYNKSLSKKNKNLYTASQTKEQKDRRTDRQTTVSCQSVRVSTGRLLIAIN